MLNKCVNISIVINICYRFHIYTFSWYPSNLIKVSKKSFSSFPVSTVTNEIYSNQINVIKLNKYVSLYLINIYLYLLIWIYVTKIKIIFPLKVRCNNFISSITFKYRLNFPKDLHAICKITFTDIFSAVTTRTIGVLTRLTSRTDTWEEVMADSLAEIRQTDTSHRLASRPDFASHRISICVFGYSILTAFFQSRVYTSIRIYLCTYAHTSPGRKVCTEANIFY